MCLGRCSCQGGGPAGGRNLRGAAHPAVQAAPQPRIHSVTTTYRSHSIPSPAPGLPALRDSSILFAVPARGGRPREAPGILGAASCDCLRGLMAEGLRKMEQEEVLIHCGPTLPRAKSYVPFTLPSTAQPEQRPGGAGCPLPASDPRNHPFLLCFLGPGWTGRIPLVLLAGGAI